VKSTSLEILFCKATGRPAMRAVFSILFYMAAAPQAFAHEIIPGLTGFPMLMLHPLVIHEQILCIGTAGLLAGRIENVRFPVPLFIFLTGMIAGKMLQLIYPQIVTLWYLPGLIALGAGLSIVAFHTIPPLIGQIGLTLLGAMVAMSIVPEMPTRWSLVESIIATMATSIILISLISWPISRIVSPWGSIGVRAFGAWQCAIAIMFLATGWYYLAL
jgi:hypothetical protein